MQAAGPAGADEDARHLGAVAFDLRRILRIRPGCCIVTVIDDVDAGEHSAAEVGMSFVDTRIEERDRDAAPVEARQIGRRAMPA